VVRSFDVTYYDKIGREDSRTRRFDVGGGIVAGYQFGNGVMFCLQAQRGIKDVLANHFAAQYSSWVAKNYNYGIVGGYTFKMKKHKAHSEEPAGTKQ
jgi:hypothetical protein